MSEICIICDREKLPEEKPLAKISVITFDRIKEYSEKWSQIGKNVILYEKMLTATFSIEWKYHRNCYSALTHKNNLQDAQHIFEARKLENTSENNNNFCANSCIICEKDNPKPSKVLSLKVANDILALQGGINHDLNIRLNFFKDPSEVVNSGIRYHSKCLSNEQQLILKQAKPVCDENNNYDQVNRDFLKAVKVELTSLGENSPTKDIKQLVEVYESFLSVEKLPPPVKSLRPYVKSLLEADHVLMSQTDFYYPPSKPSVIANKLLVSKLICNEHFRDKESDEIESLKTAKVIRKEVSAMIPWEFNGTFDNYDNPPQLHNLIKFIISDNKTLDDRKRNEVEAICSNITQYICSNFKSDRQLLYKSNKNRGFEKHRMTPLSVGTALVNYQQNKSKTEIQTLSRIGLSINYDQLERILTGIATSAIEEASKNGLGIILPSCIKKGIRPVFAADNIDLGSDAESFHGADLMIVQRKDPERESVLPVRVNN